MDKAKYSIGRDKALFFFEWLIWFSLTLYFKGRECAMSSVQTNWWIYFLSVAGVFQFAHIIFSASKIQGRLFTPYALFLAFMFVFNYGQFALWAFGIHSELEMTNTTFIRYIDPYTAVKMQVISLQFLCIFHLSAIFGFCKKKVYNVNYSLNSALKLISLPVLIVSGLINISFTFYVFLAAQTVGYAALFENALPPLLKYISYMFVPSFCLTLVAYKFSTKAFKYLTVLFAVYAVPLLITGDRGSWIYFIGPWAWCYITYVRDRSNPIKKSQIILMVTAFCLLLIAASAFKSVRDIGLNSLSLTDLVFNDLYEAFVHPLFEMGQSAVLLGVVEQDHMYDTWRFGNTFVSSILGMIMPKISTFFGYPDMYLENWFSDYLNMGNYGVGFSAFAEAYLNGGPYLGWFYMAVFGYFIGYTVTYKNENKDNVLNLFLILATSIVLGPFIRASLNLFIRMYFWGVLFVIWIASIIKRSHRNISNI